MSYSKSARSVLSLLKATLPFLCLGMLAGPAHCQDERREPATPPIARTEEKVDDISDLMEKAKRDGPDSNYFVERIAETHAVQAIPLLEQKFARAKGELIMANIAQGKVKPEDLDKAHTASALVRLGDGSDVYWDFLLQQATLAEDSGAPEFLIYNTEGKATAGPSPEFIEWAKAHAVSVSDTGSAELILLPGMVGLLGMTGDHRAIPLLRRALSSPNYQIEVAGARGLAKVQDRESIPLIKNACQKAPAGAAASIAAASLVYFDAPEAQLAAETYIPKKRLQALREEGHAPGGDPFR